MKQSLFILFVLVVGLISCTKPSDAVYDVPKEVTINGLNYEIDAHVYYFNAAPERKATIQFKRTESDSLGITIEPVSLTFLINDEIIERDFDSVTPYTYLVEAQSHQLPDWSAMTTIEVVFKFTCNGQEYKVRYSTHVCMHG